MPIVGYQAHPYENKLLWHNDLQSVTYPQKTASTYSSTANPERYTPNTEIWIHQSFIVPVK